MDDLKKTEILEAELRHCLRHVPPPEGFTDRVMERLAERTERRAAGRRLSYAAAGWRFTRPAQRWLATAAALLLTVGGGGVLHLRHQQREQQAAAAQAQMELALQLTSHALEGVQSGLDHSSAGRFAQLWNGTGN